MMQSLTILAGLVAAPFSAPAPAAEVDVAWEVPGIFIEGAPFRARLELSAGDAPAELSLRMLTPAAFSADGEALFESDQEGTIELPAGARMTYEIDLAPYLKPKGDFEMTYSTSEEPGKKVAGYRPAPEDLDFMTAPVEELGRYRVLLETNRGEMVIEFWPDVAPNHVRNFLDLAKTGFYDGILFHRVIPGFMIQGGDPNTKNPDADPRTYGTGSGPRTLQAEFSKKKHVRGVLSMARTQDPNSATSQFFVCHATAPHLDNQYTAFGTLVDGFEALDQIATAPKGQNDRPKEPQRIERAMALEPLSPGAGE